MENLSLNISSPMGEVVIRHGQALPAKEPRVVNIKGTLDAPLEYLKKRVGLIEQSKCNIIVDREQMLIVLVVGEHDPYTDVIGGQLTLHPDFVKFGINSGKYRTAIEMAEFIKMNRAHFENRQEAMNLVQVLRTFKMKIEKQVEAELNPGKGDKRVLINQAVDSNIPEKFKICMPIFKGSKKQTIEVETYFNPDDLTCTLVSPQANEEAEDFKNTAIDAVVSQIREIAGDIVIIEQ